MMEGGGLSSQTKFQAPNTSKTCKQQPSTANWNYSGSGRSNSDYKAISASQQSWSLGLAELGNKDLPAVLIRVKAELKTRQLNRNSMKSDWCEVKKCLAQAFLRCNASSCQNTDPVLNW